jgi:serine/threonine-protein kinase RsbT
MLQDTLPQHERVVGILSRFVSPIKAQGIYRAAVDHCGACPSGGQPVIDARFVEVLSRGLAVFCPDPSSRQRCVQELHALAKAAPGAQRLDPVVVPVDTEQDIVNARLSARAFAGRLGFGATDQSKIATAVSELARNIHRYAQRGSISVNALDPPRVGLRIVARDQGPGIPNLPLILSGQYKSRTGLGLGLLGCKRLMDEFAVETGPDRGTCVTLAKVLRGGGGAC